MTAPTQGPSAEALADAPPDLPSQIAAEIMALDWDWVGGAKYSHEYRQRELNRRHGEVQAIVAAALRSSAPAAPAPPPVGDELRREIEDAEFRALESGEDSLDLVLPIIERRLATERERADKAEADNRNLHLTIARISAALEITAYEQAHGKEISQIVADLRERLADIGRERNKERDAMEPTHGFMLRSLTDDGLRSLTDDGVLAHIKNRALRLSEVAELARRPTFSIRVSGALMLDARRLLDEACEELSRRFAALAPDGEG